MDEVQFNIEIASYDEKISLARLEQAKASERVRELQYEKSRFQMQAILSFAKQAEERARKTEAQQQAV